MLIRFELFLLSLLAASCASTRTEERIQSIEKQLASLRVERSSCLKEIRAIRDNQKALAADLEQRYKKAAHNIINEMMASAMETMKRFGLLPGNGADDGASKIGAPASPQSEPNKAKYSGEVAKFDASKWVKKHGDNQYSIQRRGLNIILSNTTILAGAAQIVPSVRDGKPAGFNLFAITPGSLLDALGLKNGDTLIQINGLEISTPDKALLEMYTKIRKARMLTISVRRKDQLVDLVYRIIP